MASIQHKDGKVYVVYWYKNSNGEKKQKWDACETEDEAIYYKQKIEEEKAQQTFIAPSTQSIQEYLETFVELYGTKKWGLSTYPSNVGIINNYVIPLIGKEKMQKFTTMDVAKYINQLSKYPSINYTKYKSGQKFVSANTIKEICKLLKTAWKQAMKWELVKKNVFIDATLPQHKSKPTEIWLASEIQHALDVCDDQLLYLAMNFAFSCSTRVSEMVGITWDCVFVEDSDIENDNARVLINKQLLRVDKNLLETISKDEVMMVFENYVNHSCKTIKILKSLKMNGDERIVWIPRTVAYMLKEWKKEQQKIKDMLGENYEDYGLVFCFENGRPCLSDNIVSKFKKLIKEFGLKKVKFHSLRHSSTTYKLKLSHGDIKAVQGDTGHKSPDMVTKRYSHIIDEDRKINATRFDDEFYTKKENINSKEEDMQEVNDLLMLLKSDDNLRNELKKLLSI